MLRSWRVSERWGLIAPIRRVEPFRDDEPAERQWIRYLPSLDIRTSIRKDEASSFVADWSTAALYNESGRIRSIDMLEVGIRIDLEI